MPIYEYRCPEGHTFELFQRMSDPPPSGCQICGAAPVSKVLYPAAIHFKGSGFYSTDYGRGNRRRDGAKDGAAPSEGGEKAAEKPAGEGEKKAAAAEG
jgi:putative FmdB family regulatory protein